MGKYGPTMFATITPMTAEMTARITACVTRSMSTTRLAVPVAL